MAKNTAALVTALRDKPGACMMNCKMALNENDADIEASVDWLRTQGLAAAAKKSGRVASEGLVGITTDGGKGAIVEINAETDFVARNEDFQTFVENVSSIVLRGNGKLEDLKANAYVGGTETVEATLTNMIAKIGENMELRRSASLEVSNGVVCSYMHNALKPGLGKIGVLVALESDVDAEQLEALGKQLAMHVAAANPQAISRDDVDADDIEREKTILAEQARESGKPDDIIAKMVEGRLRKYYEEMCLLEQTYVIDGDTKVGKVIETAGKEIGAPIILKSFVRCALGEGVEKKEEDFRDNLAYFKS